MFGPSGGSGFGGFGQQNQQQNQQQPQQQQPGGLFGSTPQANTAGTSTGFGGFGAAPQQQQQPAFGASTAGGGGLFGQPQQQQPASSAGGGGFSFGQTGNAAPPAFGQQAQANQPKPAGFGGFGASTSGPSTAGFGGFGAQQAGQQPAFGASTSTNAFGAKITGGSLFGQQQAQPQAGAFGQPAQTGGLFGGNNANNNALSAQQTGGMPSQGTSNPPYQPFVNTEKDATGTGSTTYQYNTITCLPAYRAASVEELRVQDYQQGRKTGNAGPGAGIGGGGFGQPANTGGAFGAAANTGGGLFGQQQQQQQPSTGFGGGGLFGGQTNTQQPQQSGGLFGSTTNTGGGLFGQPAQQQQAQPGGLFGQQQQPASTGFTFGSGPQQQQQQQQPASSGFTFGQNAAQNKPAGGGLFGGGATGGFGSSTSQQQPASSGFTFGGANTSQAPQTGAFGAPAASGGGFGFGSSATANQPKPGGLFGGATSTAPTFGGFGATSAAATDANKPAFSFGGGGFGGASNAPGQTTTAAPTGGLFGGQNTSTTGQGGGFSFGGGANNAASNTGAAGGFSFGGLGGNQQQQQQQPNTGFGAGGSSLFGQNKPATGGLFGQPAQQNQPPGQSNTGAFNFGASSNTAGGQAGGGGLFGGASSKPGGLFGGSTLGATQSGQGGGLFGSNTTGGAQQNSGGGGLFGGAGQASGQGSGLFGNTQSNPLGGGGGGLFGGGGLGASTGGFGAPSGGQQGSLFGGGLSQTQSTAPNLQTSLNANPYGTDFLFGGAASTNAGLASNFSGSTSHQQQQQPLLPFNVSRPSAKKQPPLVPPFRPSPRNTARIAKLRGSTPGGFRDSTPAGREGSPSLFAATTRLSSPSTASSMGGSLFRGLSDDLPSSARAQREGSVPASAQAFANRPSVKRLVLDDQTNRSSINGSTSLHARSQSLFGSRAAAADDSVVSGRTTSLFDRSTATPQQLGTRDGDREATLGDESSFVDSVLGTNAGNAAARRNVLFGDSPSKTGDNDDDVREQSLPSLAATGKASKSAAGGKDDEAPLPLGYYTSPPLSELRDWSHAELRSVEGFVVGRKGFGSVQFVEPVDLTTVGELSNVPGGIVQLRKKECYVYPDEEDCFDSETGNERDGVQPGFDPKRVPGGKASRGQGLNVPAVVHLEGCWPLDRSTRQPIKDGEHVRVKQMVAKLKRRSDMDFKGYEPASGTWSFRVEHFSRYGLDDEDEEEGENGSGAKPAPSGVAAAATQKKAGGKEVKEVDAPPRRALDEVEDEVDSDADADADMPEAATQQQQREASLRRSVTPRVTPQPTTVDAASQPWAASLGLEARRMQVMQASFFGGGGESPRQVTATTTTSKQKAPLLGKKNRLLSPSPAPSYAGSRSNFAAPMSVDPVADDATNKTVSHKPTGKLTKTDVQEEFDMSLAPPSRPRKVTKLALDSSVTDDGHSVVLDAGLAMGRSFRVGWGPDGTFVHRGKVLKPSSSEGSSTSLPPLESFSTVKLNKLAIFKAEEVEHESDTIVNLLKVQLKHSIIEAGEDDGDADEDACPVIYPSPALRFREFASAMSAASNTSKDLHYEAAVFRLASALFDEIKELNVTEEMPRDVVNTIVQLRRKNNVANWIRWYVEEAVRGEVRTQIASPGQSSGEKMIFSFLSGGFFEDACRQALEMGNVRLATLLAQANGGGSDDEYRLDLLDQLSVWRASGADAMIAPEYRRVVELLSGNVLFSKGNGKRADDGERVDDMAIAAGLDWIRTFALFLHFDQRFEAGLDESVLAYEQSIGRSEDGEHVIVPPLPPYLERNVKPGSKRFRDLVRAQTYAEDVLFALLKLFSQADIPLEAALAPQQYGASTCNFGVAFHLAQVLSPRVLGVRDFSDRLDLGIEGETVARMANWRGNSARHDNLCVQYAMQLEVMGHWTWAAFVLLHLEMRDSRHKTVMALLTRNVEQLQDDGAAAQTFLVDTLKVPIEWIYEARAEQAGYRHDRFAEYSHLLRARRYGRAHEVAARYLAPEGIVRHDFAMILDLFAPFRKSVISSSGHKQDEEMAAATASANDEVDVPGWQAGGQVYVDYIAICGSLPWLVHENASSLVAAVETELDDVQVVGRRSQPLSLDRVTAIVQDALGAQAADVVRRIDRSASKIPGLMVRVDALFDDGGIVGVHGDPTTAMVARSQMVASLQNCVRSLKATRTLARLARIIPSLEVSLPGTGDEQDTSSSSRAPPIEVENLHFMANAYCASLVEGSA